MKFKYSQLKDLKIIDKPAISGDVFTIMVGEDSNHYYAVYVCAFEINGVVIPDLDKCGETGRVYQKGAKCNEHLKNISPYVGELKFNQLIYTRDSEDEEFKPVEAINVTLEGLITKFFGSPRKETLDTQIVELESKVARHCKKLGYDLDTMTYFEFSSIINKDLSLIQSCSILCLLYSIDKEG